MVAFKAMRMPAGRTTAVLVSCLMLAATATAQRRTGSSRKAAEPRKSTPAKEDGAVPTAEESADGDDDAIEVDADEPEPTVNDKAGDSKLDERPPPTKGNSGEQKLSPLNPEQEEFPGGTPPRSPGELTKLLSDIATLRGRVAALTTSLYSSKLRIYVRTDGDEARIDRFNLTLDEGTVFQAPARFVAEDSRVVYEHAVAPGNHVVGVEVERHDARRATYKTWQVSKFAITVPDKELLELDMRIEDDSDIAEDFPDDQDGEYELGVRMRVRVTE